MTAEYSHRRRITIYENQAYDYVGLHGGGQLSCHNSDTIGTLARHQEATFVSSGISQPNDLALHAMRISGYYNYSFLWKLIIFTVQQH